MARFISIIDLGNALRNLGYDVGEHSQFGGVAPVHSDNSHHYRDQALDINWRGAGSEAARLQTLGSALRKAGLDELFYPGNDPVGGHDGHMHAADSDGKIRVTKRLGALLGSRTLGSMPSFPTPGVPGSSYNPDFTVPEYPTTPLPIPAATQAAFAERRAAAHRALTEARLAKRRGSSDIRGDFRRFISEIDTNAQRGRDAVMNEASSRNLALQPAFVVPGLKRVREDRSNAAATAVAEKQERLRALDDAVNSARRYKQDTKAGIQRDRARVRSELDRLIGI